MLWRVVLWGNQMLTLSVALLLPAPVCGSVDP